MPAYWLHILVYQNLPGVFVARSLEHDITVDGATLDRTLDWILRIIRAHVDLDRRHGRPALSTFPAAPQRYWAAFEQATPIRTVTCGSEDRPVLIAFSAERPAPQLPALVQSSLTNAADPTRSVTAD